MFRMKYRRRVYYSAEPRAEIRDPWQRVESMSSIGRAFERQSSSVFSVISPTGGHSPAGSQASNDGSAAFGTRRDITWLEHEAFVACYCAAVGACPLNDQPRGSA